MAEPVSLVVLLGSAAGALASGVAGNEAHSLFRHALDRFADESLDDNGLPRNHDVFAASEDALREAIRLLLLQLELELVQQKPWIPRLIDLVRSGQLGRTPFVEYGEDPCGRWLAVVIRELPKVTFRDLHLRDLDLGEDRVRACFEKEGLATLFGESAHDAILGWIKRAGEQSGGSEPASLERFVRDGWPVGAGKRLTLMQAYALFFREQLKQRPEVFRILTIDYLADVAKDVKSLPERVRDLFRREFGALAGRLDEVTLALGESNAAIERLLAGRIEARAAIASTALDENATSLQADLLDALRSYESAFRAAVDTLHHIPVRRPVVPALPSPGPEANDLVLLHAKQRSIPLRGRDRDLADLWQWFESDAPVSARLLIGRAGAGKTRLAFELIWRIAATYGSECTAGVVERTDLLAYERNHAWADWSWEKPSLLVIDYAQPLSTSLCGLLRRLAEVDPENPSRPKLRLLLLDRYASEHSGWFSDLLNDYSAIAGGPVSACFDPPVPVPVTELDTTEVRLEMFRDTMNALARLRRKPLAPLSQEERDAIEANLVAERWEDPLYLMMAALVASDGSGFGRALGLGRTDLAHEVARREARRISSFVQSAPGDDKGKLLCHLAAVATMRGGLLQDEQLEAVQGELEAVRREWSGGTGALRDVLRLAMQVSEAGMIPPIQPDIVAEAFTLDHLCGGDRAGAEAALRRAAELDPGLVCRRVCHAIQNFDSVEPTRDKETLGRWMAVLLDAAIDGADEVLDALAAAMPEFSLSLASPAVDVARLLVERARRHHPVSEVTEAEESRATLASSLNNYGTRLSAVGSRDEALEAAREAVEIRRELVDRNRKAYLPDLAMSLGAMGTVLTAADQSSDAAAAFAEGVRCLTPHFLAQPAAFISLIAALARDHLRAAEQAGIEPEYEVLAPIAEHLQQPGGDD
ncbi:MAG: tetratricopeptide repeat protein [bacterium]|nr:tetratricopeptide repeat protein [bacterium]